MIRTPRCQAVLLPVEFSFAGEHVYATRDEIGGDVVLSEIPGRKTWREFFELADSIEAPEFMSERPMNVVAREPDLFE